jgi:DNA-directed RNA polymerase
MIDLTQQLHRQEELENHCLQQGAERFQRMLDRAKASGKGSTVGGAKKLLQLSVQQTRTTLEEMLTEAARPGRRGRKHVAVKWVKMIGVDVAAFIACRCVVDALLNQRPAQYIAREIVNLMLDELRFRRYKKLAPRFFEYHMATFHTNSYTHMARSLSQRMERAQCQQCYTNSVETCTHLDMSDLELPPTAALAVGYKCIDAVVSSTGMCTVELRRVVEGRRMKTQTILTPTEQTKAWLDARNTALLELWPINLPMVVPPLPWAKGERGGYRFAMRGKHALIRAARFDQSALDLPVVYEALNRVQETAWKVNTKVLEVVERVMAKGGELVGIPRMEDTAQPRKPPEIPHLEDELRVWRTARRQKRADVPQLGDEATAYREEWKQWRTRAHTVNEENHTHSLRRQDFFNTLSIATAIRNEPAVWFPYNCDFRGRIYPIVAYLSPQGDDLSKGILTFADGKALGQDGASWLAIHGANCLKDSWDGVKLNRATLQERVDWIVAHSQDIERIATDPLMHTDWMTADKPWQFLAFCFEWQGYVALVRQDRGEEYVCSLPCAMDGTCNGLQHFAALLLDERAAKHTNVLPQSRPEDIYLDVSEMVLSKLEALAAEDSLAALWLTSGLVDRKFVKRPAMTFAYGSKRFGFKQQLMTYLNDPRKVDVKRVRQHFNMGDGRNVLSPACHLLASLIWDSLEVFVPRAFRGMAWLQQSARAAVAGGEYVSWTVPATGFPVVQAYSHGARHDIKTILAGRVTCVKHYEPDARKPHARKQTNAVAPNVIHSLDAAALMLTVQAAAQEGVEAFALVHDSYGTLPTDCPVLAQCTRQAFYALYSDRDVLAHIEGCLQAVAPGAVETFPVKPLKGKLDLGGVLVSDYFFS